MSQLNQPHGQMHISFLYANFSKLSWKVEQSGLSCITLYSVLRVCSRHHRHISRRRSPLVDTKWGLRWTWNSTFRLTAFSTHRSHRTLQRSNSSALDWKTPGRTVMISCYSNGIVRPHVAWPWAQPSGLQHSACLSHAGHCCIETVLHGLQVARAHGNIYASVMLWGENGLQKSR